MTGLPVDGAVPVVMSATAALFRGTELLQRRLDEARIEHVRGRRRHGEVAELHVEFRRERLDRRVEAAVDAPQVLAVEIADHVLEEREIEIGQPFAQYLGR